MTTHVSSLDQSLLRRLATVDHGGPWVSVYLPPVRGMSGRHAAADLAAGLLRDARTALAAAPWQCGGNDIDRIVTGLAEQLDTSARLDDQGLAVFATTDAVESIVLPGGGPAEMSIGPRPDLAAAAEALARTVAFHLLVLSQHRVELHRVDADGIHPLDEVDLPASADDAAWFERHPTNLSVHGGSQVGNGAIGGGRGGTSARDHHKDAVIRFVAAVDRALPAAVHDGPLPLVVAAVAHEAAMLRDTRSHRDLVLLTELGSPERTPVATLAAAARTRLAPRADAEVSALLERARSLAGTGMTISAPTALYEAARTGQIDTLLVDPERRAAAGVLERNASIDAVAATLAHRGQVRLLPVDANADDLALGLLRY